MNDFAQATNFRQFHAEQQDTYDRLIQSTNDLCAFDMTQDWLTAQFPVVYDSHHLIRPSLVNGAHNAMIFETEDSSLVKCDVCVSIQRNETAADMSIGVCMRLKRLTLTGIFTSYIALIGACIPAQTNTTTTANDDITVQDSVPTTVNDDTVSSSDALTTPDRESVVTPTLPTDSSVTQYHTTSGSETTTPDQSDESLVEDVILPMLTAEAEQVFAEPISAHNPEVYELVTIALAIANLEDFYPQGMATDGLIDKRTAYYQKVDAHFGNFRDHPLIKKIRAVYPPMIVEPNIVGMVSYRLQSLAYRFNDQDELVLDTTYQSFSKAQQETPAFASTTLPFNLDDSDTLTLLSDFARQTNFRQFYAEQQGEYNRLIQLSNDLCEFEGARNWLATQFPAAYDSHYFVFSPLLGDIHYVTGFSTADKNFTQLVMYVPTFKGLSQTATDVWVGARVDHCGTSFIETSYGYVNPITELHLEAVEQTIPDITLWNTDPMNQTIYDTAYKTFNEYMTRAVYSLYIIDTVPIESQEATIQFQEALMVTCRGFTQFPAFNREVIRLYETREPTQTISDLYPAILDWFAAQTPTDTTASAACANM